MRRVLLYANFTLKIAYQINHQNIDYYNKKSKLFIIESFIILLFFYEINVKGYGRILAK